MQTEPFVNFDGLLASLAEIRNEKERLNGLLSAESKKEVDVERKILDAMDSCGLTADGQKVGSAFGTATRQTKWRAVYDPEKWPEVVKWCAENGRTDLIQRRLSDARVMEIVDRGETLPDGITPQSYTDLLFRRK